MNQETLQQWRERIRAVEFKCFYEIGLLYAASWNRDPESVKKRVRESSGLRNILSVTYSVLKRRNMCEDYDNLTVDQKKDLISEAMLWLGDDKVQNEKAVILTCHCIIAIGSLLQE